MKEAGYRNFLALLVCGSVLLGMRIASLIRMHDVSWGESTMEWLSLGVCLYFVGFPLHRLWVNAPRVTSTAHTP